MFSSDDQMTVINKGSVLWANDQRIELDSSGNWTNIAAIKLPQAESIFQHLPVKKNHRDLKDADHDGLDNDEEALWGTDKNNPDTDGDGYWDGVEVSAGYSPLDTLGYKLNPDKQKIYGKIRLVDFSLEQAQAAKLKKSLDSVLLVSEITSSSYWWTLVNAYIYGRYTVDEIADTILHGPAAVHPGIPAGVWRATSEYEIYLNRLD